MREVADGGFKTPFEDVLEKHIVAILEVSPPPLPRHFFPTVRAGH
jgi:hypothetical protein